MIVFDLKCGCGHVFEGWFASSAAYEQQRADGLVSCTLCGSALVDKAAMAPRLSLSGRSPDRGGVEQDGHQNTPPSTTAPASAPSGPVLPGLPEPLIALARLQQAMIARSTWVGNRFAECARAAHEGPDGDTPIHGTADREDVMALREEGIAVMPLIIPIVPPEYQN